MRGKKGYTLQFTIGLLVIFSVLLTALVSSYTSVKANKDSLTTRYLENNHQYARKLASNTSSLLSSMQQNINSFAAQAKTHSFTQEELDFWLNAQKHYFNSVFIVDANRFIQKVSPEDTGLVVGSRLVSEQSVLAVKRKKPFISDPYMAKSGRLIVLVSSPIFDEKGVYQGYVGGTIYLEEENVLSVMLNEHFYGNGSYVYVVDHQGDLIFHPDKNRINERVLPHNKIIEKVVSGKSGSEQARNSLGKEFFAGYAFEPSTGWGIVSQTPVSVIREPLEELILLLILQGLPLLLVILLVAWQVTTRISRPLHQLAKFSEDAVLEKNTKAISAPMINSKIYEVRQLYYHISNHFNHLNTEIQVDGLTGLANRKSFDCVIQDWMKNQIPFCLILLDIDHFKKVNDTYGHLVGDDVLKFLASLMQSVSRDGDFCFRYGGEEFGILVKQSKQSKTFLLAERLRQEIEQTKSPTGGAITVSIGISCYQNDDQNAAELIERADLALYQSKTGGRNRTTVYY